MGSGNRNANSLLHSLLRKTFLKDLFGTFRNLFQVLRKRYLHKFIVQRRSVLGGRA